MDDLNIPIPTGQDLLHDPVLNKGTAFTMAERDALGLHGLLPPHVATVEEQVERVLENVRRKDTDLEKYIFMLGLQDRNETLFYRVVMENVEEFLPILYTPTVGQACKEYAHIFRRSRGLFITIEDRGRVRDVLDNWRGDVSVIVVTDGERILGLGDLGANGMGIPVGKLTLYTACAGIHPGSCLPITLDVGTNNDDFRHDPLYLGLNRERERSDAYDDLIEEFVTAVQDKYPNALIQFEDFGNRNAFRLLEKYRERARVFNDDIQGTAAVTMAGLYSASRITGLPLIEQKFLFLGAGEAGLGIGELVVSAMMAAGMSEADARLRNWFVDSRGLIVKGRENVNEHKAAFAHDHEHITDFHEAIQAIQPTGIVGVSGMPNTFTPEIIRTMAELNERPLIFALSNPTANSECSAADAYTHSDGRAIFASGSPFPTFEYNGQQFVPGQANNAYVFPGIGLGVVVSGARTVTDEVFAIAAKTLAEMVSKDDLALGRIYPSLKEIRHVSHNIATAVAELAYERGLATRPQPDDISAAVVEAMYQPVYRSYV